MHYCTGHMTELRNKLREMGLWYLVDVNPAVVKRRAERWLAGNAYLEEFDPLVVMMLEINAKVTALQVYVAERGCPLCAVQVAKVDLTMADKWIEGFAEIVMEIARKNNIPQRMTA